MPKIAFQKVPDQKPEFIEVEAENYFLIPVCYSFAKTLDTKEAYDAIMNERVSIYINDELIKVDDWHITEVQDNDKVLISPNIEGGDSGFLMIALGAILMIVAPYLGAVVLWGEMTLGTLAFSLGVSMVLGGLSNLLFQPDLPSSPSISSSKQTQTYNWGGIQTVAQIDTPVPIVYGMHPVGGNVISLFVESDGAESYLNMLLALCEGEIEGIVQDKNHTAICSTSDLDAEAYRPPAIKIDEQPLSFYNDVEWWYRKGTNLDGGTSRYNPDYQSTIPGFDGARLQYDDGREILGDDWVEYITTKEVDQVYLNFVNPQLYNGAGTDLTSETVTFKVQYSTDGVSYSNYEGSGTYKYEPSVLGIYYRSGLCTCTSYKSGPYKYTYKPPTYTLKVTSNNYSEVLQWLKRGAAVATNIIGYELYDVDSNLLETNTVEQKVYQHVQFGGGEGGDPTIYGPIRLIPTEFYAGEYAVTLDPEVRAGFDRFTLSSEKVTGPSSPIISVTGKTKTGIYTTIRLDFNEEGLPGQAVYYLRTIRTDGGKSDDLKIADNLILQSVIEVVDGAFIYPNTALLGLRIKATGQLSGAPPNVITLLKGTKIEVPDLSGSQTFQTCFWDEDQNRWEYNGAERTWDNSTYTTEYSNNSLLCVRDLALSERYGLGDYYSSTDFDISEIITSIRECWKRYDSYSAEDYLKWWDSGTDANWLNGWALKYAPNPFGEVDITDSYDSSARTITINGTGVYNQGNQGVGYVNIDFNTTTTLKKGQDYDLSVTLSGVDFPVDIVVRGIPTASSFYGFGSTSQSYLGTLSQKSSGTHTLSFTDTGAFRAIRLQINGTVGSSSYVISDVSLTKEADSYEHYHTWNGVIESGQSALTVLVEMCDVFRCWPVWHSGKINFIMDRDTTPVQTLSVGNTESFSQAFTPLSEIPYRLIGQFTDEAREYNLRSLVSKSSLSDLIKINEKTIGLKGLTSKAKAERELKFKHSKSTICTHSVSLKCGIDILHGSAGDIVNLQDDLPIWGHGGNILSYTATNFTIDTPYIFSNAATDVFVVKYQGVDNTQLSATIDTAVIASNDSLQTFPMISIPGSPCALSAFSLDKTGYSSKKFRLISTNRTEEDKVEIAGIEHFSSLYDSESALTTIIDNPSPLVPKSPTLIPKPPINIRISPLSPYEGLGFSISARPAEGDYGVNEIVVEIDRTGNGEFENIGSLFSPIWATTYTDASLKIEYTYRFRLFCKTPTKIGSPAQASCVIPGSAASILPPKGLRIKGATLNSNEFDDRDVTIIWDSSGLSTDLNYSVKGYKINIYKDTILRANLLRTDFVTNEEYTYAYFMNVGDNGVANSTLVFQLTTLITNGWESVNSSHITVSNSSPSAPTGLTTTPWMRGVQFNWDKNTETDLSHYSYRTRGLNTGQLAFDEETGTFTAGNTIYQTVGGVQVASATIDVVGSGVLYLSNISGTFVDDEIIYEASYGSELLTNGDMELDANWGNWSTPTTNEQSVEQKHGDTYSRKFIGNSSGDGIINQTATLVVDSFYKITGWVYISALTADSVKLSGCRTDTWATYPENDGTSTIGSWVELSIIFQSDHTGYGIIFSQYVDGTVTTYADDASVKQITNAALADGAVTYDEWSTWVDITNTEVSRFLNETEGDEHGHEVTIHLQVKAVDVYGNESAVAEANALTLGLNVKSSDIEKYAIVASKVHNKIPVITGDSWEDNTVLASEIQWNVHNIYYNGTLCVIASGHTSDKYIYWRNLATSYNTSATTHPTSLASPLDDDDFIIAVNIDGTHDLAWNSIANQVIGSAYIQNLAVQEAHIAFAAIGTAQIASLAVIDGHIANLDAAKILANTITVSKLAYPTGNVFRDVFDDLNSDTDTRWVSYSGSGERSIVESSDAVSGGKFYRIGDNSGNDQLWMIESNSIPLDPSQLYKVRCRIRQTQGTGTCYIGVAGRNYDNSAWVNSAGTDSYSSQHYIVAVAVDPTSAWTEYTGYFKGTSGTGDTTAHPNPGDPAVLHEDCRFFRPLILVNYSGAAGIYEIDEFTITAVPDTDESPWRSGDDSTYINGGRIYTGSITGDRIDLTSYLSIKSNVFGNDGIQLQYNANNPRMYVGNGSNEYFKYDGTNIEISLSKSAALTIKSGGDIVVESGGDIIMQGASSGSRSTIVLIDNSLPGALEFRKSSDPTNTALCHSIYKVATNEALYITPINLTTPYLYIGSSARNYYRIYMYASDRISLEGPVYINDALVRPYLNNTTTLGTSSICFADIYAYDNSLSTCSMRAVKSQISIETLGLDFINALQPLQFVKTGLLEKKGFMRGVIIEDVEAALDEVGYSVEDFGGITTDINPDTGEEVKAIKYGHFWSPTIKAIQEMYLEIEGLKAEVDLLKN